MALIISAANASHAQSYETTAFLGSKPFAVTPGRPTVVTNFFQNASWGLHYPQPRGLSGEWGKEVGKRGRWP